MEALQGAPSQHAPARGESLRQDTELNLVGVSPPQEEKVLDTFDPVLNFVVGISPLCLGCS